MQGAQAAQRPHPLRERKPPTPHPSPHALVCPVVVRMAGCVQDGMGWCRWWCNGEGGHTVRGGLGSVGAQAASQNHAGGGAQGQQLYTREGEEGQEGGTCSKRGERAGAHMCSGGGGLGEEPQGAFSARGGRASAGPGSPRARRARRGRGGGRRKGVAGSGIPFGAIAPAVVPSPPAGASVLTAAPAPHRRD